MVSEKWQLNTSRRIIKRKCFETFSWFYYEYDGKIGRKKVASETKKIAKSWNIKKIYTKDSRAYFCASSSDWCCLEASEEGIQVT